MPARRPVLVKFGGSLLTNKSTRGPPRYRPAVGDRLARELADGLRKTGARSVLVHGAGSFGHPLVLRYGIGKRRIPASDVGRLLHAIASRVGGLRERVLASCRRARLPSLGLPLSVLTSTHGRRTRLRVELLSSVLRMNRQPVTGGDVVPDARWGLRVLGGDELLVHLARALRPRLVIVATDVDGVLLDGRLLLELPAAQGRRVLDRIPAGRDATGGMHGKLAAALQVAAAGVPVRLVNGLVPGRVRKALAGGPVWGTEIHA